MSFCSKGCKSTSSNIETLKPNPEVPTAPGQPQQQNGCCSLQASRLSQTFMSREAPQWSYLFLHELWWWCRKQALCKGKKANSTSPISLHPPVPFLLTLSLMYNPCPGIPLPASPFGPLSSPSLHSPHRPPNGGEPALILALLQHLSVLG